MLKIPARSRTTLLGTLSCQVIPKNVSETTHMEGVQLPLLLCTKSPGLTAGQEGAQDTGSIDLDLGIFCQLLIKPYSLCESREHGGCFPNAFIQLDIERVSEIVDKVHKVINNLQFLRGYGNRGR